MDERIEDILKHEYDPVKAREYYLRTRELKGRFKGIGEETTSSRTSSNTSSTTKSTSGRWATLDEQKQANEKRAARVKELKGRLDELNKILEVLMDQIRAKNNGKIQDTSSKSSSNGGSSKLTAAQKKDAAKRSAEYREKNPEKIKKLSEDKQLEEKIAAVQEKIKKMREKLSNSTRNNQSKGTFNTFKRT